MVIPLYLLDTNILLALIRGSRLGQYIDATYRLLQQLNRPLLCIVSEGEMRSLAVQFRWGPRKVQAMERLLLQVRIWDLSRAGIIPAYVQVDLASRAYPAGARNLSQNDLWIAATATATGAILLTTDKDFDHLHPTHLQRIYIDPASALPAAGSPP